MTLYSTRQNLQTLYAEYATLESHIEGLKNSVDFAYGAEHDIMQDQLDEAEYELEALELKINEFKYRALQDDADWLIANAQIITLGREYSELNAAVLVSTFPPESGTYKADLYGYYRTDVRCAVYHGTCPPMHAVFLETITISLKR